MSDIILGLRPREELTLSCVNCEEKLVKLVLISKEFDYKSIFKANCPFCGDSSEPLELEGKYLYNEAEKTVVQDAIVDNDGEIFSFNFKVDKK